MLKQIPNILTFGRLVGTLVFLAMLLYLPYVQNKTTFIDTAFIIFVVSGLTDIIDGPVARRLNVASKFGRMLDPLADKVLVCGAFVCFAIIGQPEFLFNWSKLTLHLIRWSVAAILIIREGYVTVLRHVAEAKGIDFRAVASGKIKMLIQSFSVGTILVKAAHVQTALWGHWFTIITLAVMLAVTVVSGYSATRRIPSPR
ncbi:MAG: CDP-alcohol phosphatidyltransferase family protein [Sedimentisphaerales bacterium]|nr:CDP-alcohol phosphatidyltransferase family protein [Sedimentisphaerales bacterium]